MNTTQHRRCWRTPPRRDGFIVLVVMIVIVMITLAGLSYVLTLSTENKAVHRQGDQLQLDEALASGMELLKAFCSQSAQLREESGGTQDNAAVFGNLVMPGDGGARDVLQLSIISPAVDGQAGDAVRFGLQNESARLNLGVLADWERRVPGSAAAALLQLPGMSESTAAAILDWLDADGQPRRAAPRRSTMPAWVCRTNLATASPRCWRNCCWSATSAAKPCSARTRTSIFKWTPANPRRLRRPRAEAVKTACPGRVS